MADLTTQLPRAPIVAPQTVWLRPALEVDQFRWPESCQCIVAGAGAALDHCVQKILSTARGGRRVVMISGDERGAGRTTFLLCLAQRLSVIGVKTALADADFANPQLARRLGLVPEAGWDDVLSGEVELAEVMIDSLADKLSLVPAVGKLRSVEEIKSQPWTKAIDILRSNYQVVLVDAPPAEEFLTLDGGAISGIEAAILVQRGKSNHAANIARQLRLREINPLGQVENFVDLTVGPT